MPNRYGRPSLYSAPLDKEYLDQIRTHFRGNIHRAYAELRPDNEIHEKEMPGSYVSLSTFYKIMNGDYANKSK